jgi:hypothetical protein
VKNERTKRRDVGADGPERSKGGHRSENLFSRADFRLRHLHGG